MQSALEGLREVHVRIRELVLFSSNESLDDISTRDLVYLTLPYVFAEVENRVQTTERMDRMSVLSSTIVCPLCTGVIHFNDLFGFFFGVQGIPSSVRASVRALRDRPRK